MNYSKLFRLKGISLFKQIILYVCAVFLNIAFNKLCSVFNIPLFLDCIGTLLAAILGGYLPGIFVGYITNIINSFQSPENAYYAGISVLIAVTGTFFYRKKFYESYWKALLTVPFFAFIGGVLGSLLTYLMYGFGLGEGISAPFALHLLEKGRLSVFQAQLISDVTIDAADKFITVTVVFLLLKIIPQNIKENLVLTDWKQSPMVEEELKQVGETKTRQLGLKKKVIWIIGILVSFVALVTSAISFFLYRKVEIEQYTHMAKNIATLVSLTIDADKVDEYLAKGGIPKGYKEMESRLYRIKESSPFIEYIYVYKILEDGCHVVFDLDSDELPGAKLGTVVPFEDSFKQVLPALLMGKQIEPVISNDSYGWLLSDYEPVFDSNGNCVCYACADISLEDVHLNGIGFLVKVISLFIGFFILILMLCIWFTNFHVIYPIDALTFAAEEFAFNTKEAREVSIARLNSLCILTGDEIENLYTSLCATIKETVGYVQDLQKKNEEITKMQNGLIYLMADLVESRDKCTGDHIKRTASYVKLILELLVENNMFSDLITPKYIFNVCASAPLHDVGKINVSDSILNKPGKLTEEEFEQMKMHTTAGKKIIEGAMQLTADSGYLNEALNLALYHHEKWDGTGYPQGLKAEEIPLSARIMAVSDVFDALVSSRSYKEPFSFDKAMEIIKEGAGKHFDPVIANLFYENRDKVKEIFEEKV